MESLKKVSEDCEVRRRVSSAPRRFELTVETEALSFNHLVQVDTMFIHGCPIVHMVDKETHFCAASFLRSQPSKELWKTIQRMWSLVHLGPPNYLVVDQRSAYTSKEMRPCTEEMGVRLHEAPIEPPGSIGMLTQYHAPLRLAYERVRINAYRQNSDEECLQLAAFAINCTAGPDGLCLIPLVFGAVPRPARAMSA